MAQTSLRLKWRIFTLRRLRAEQLLTTRFHPDTLTQSEISNLSLFFTMMEERQLLQPDILTRAFRCHPRVSLRKCAGKAPTASHGNHGRTSELQRWPNGSRARVTAWY